jgi:hypothetical protein
MYKGKIPYSIFLYIIFGGLIHFIILFVVKALFDDQGKYINGSEFKFFGFLIFIFLSSLFSLIIFLRKIRDSILLSYLILLIPTIIGMFLYFKEIERDKYATINSEIIKYAIFYILQFIYWYTILRPRKVVDDEEE